MHISSATACLIEQPPQPPAGGTLPVGLGQAGAGIFFIVDALDTKAKGYDVTISFPQEGIGTAAEAIAMIFSFGARGLIIYELLGI